jgi:Ku protein, prokaryotic
MPATRPIWKGQLRLSLVSIPVELFSAARSGARPSFRQIHEPTGKPIHYEKVVAGIGPVDRDEIIKGFEYEKGDYVLLTDAEIDAVKLETRKTLELTQFVGACEIDPIYYDKSYFVVPTDDLAEDAFRVIRDALRETQKVGLGQLALRGKEYLAAIKPSGTGLMLETLHYEDEIRKADPFFSQISRKKAEPDLLEVATALIEKKTAPFDASAFKDHYQSALRELIRRKMKAKGRKITATEEEAPERPSGANVVDLMSALKESLEGGGGKRSASSGKSTRRKAG